MSNREYEINWPAPDDPEAQTREEREGQERLDELTAPDQLATERVVGPTWTDRDTAIALGHNLGVNKEPN